MKLSFLYIRKKLYVNYSFNFNHRYMYMYVQSSTGTMVEKKTMGRAIFRIFFNFQNLKVPIVNKAYKFLLYAGAFSVRRI